MKPIGLVLAALAANADILVVGLTYGLRGIRVGWLSNAWIALLAGLAMLASLLAGATLRALVPPSWAGTAGGAILALLGLQTLWSAYPGRSGPDRDAGSSAPGWKKVLALLAAPEQADRDQSRAIDAREATLLGVALSLNNLAVGFGAGLAHFSWWATPLATAALSFAAFLAGHAAGRRYGRLLPANGAAAAAGLLLMLLGVAQMVHR